MSEQIKSSQINRIISLINLKKDPQPSGYSQTEIWLWYMPSKTAQHNLYVEDNLKVCMKSSLERNMGSLTENLLRLFVFNRESNKWARKLSSWNIQMHLFMFQTVTEKTEFNTQRLCVCKSSSIRNSSEVLFRSLHMYAEWRQIRHLLKDS